MLREIDRAAERGRAGRRPPGRDGCRLFAMIESARAVLNAYAIATASDPACGRSDPRPRGPARWTWDSPPDRRTREPSQHARCHLVLAARAARVDAVDAIYLNIQDHDGLRGRGRSQAAGMGFVGKQVIHPAQIPIVHAAFTPSAERVRRAERVLEVVADRPRPRGRAWSALDGMLLGAAGDRHGAAGPRARPTGALTWYWTGEPARRCRYRGKIPPSGYGRGDRGDARSSYGRLNSQALSSLSRR